MVVVVAFLGVFSIPLWLSILGLQKSAHKCWHIIGLSINLQLANRQILCFPLGLLGNLLSRDPIFVTELLGGGNVPSLKRVHLHTVADQQVVRQPSLVELNVIFVVFIFFLIQ